MQHLPPMIQDLAVILCAAAVATVVFSKLRQPVVLGYLIAGFAVGPHFPLWPTVVDKGGVHLWAEIGVIFLLFGLGLEFSFKKLAKVGKSAFIAATFEIITMSGVGYLFGQALGWTTIDSIYLGAILSMSSTTIIIRAFAEAGLKNQGFANLVFGILIVEDLMAILLMVILSAISVPGSFSGSKLAFLSGRLVFFLLIWFLVGIYILPTLLKRVRAYLSDEIMLVVSIGLCFMMVALATKTGFSAALGAFIMGSILAETEEGERIEHLLMSVKDLFGAVFFVSVGMMIDPLVLKDNFMVVVLITIITIVGKLLGSGFGAALSGRSLRHSTQAGMSLAQIGEFSFIIASLGVSLKVLSEFVYPIVIAVSAVTTFTTPYMIKHSGPIYDWIEARLPRRLLDGLQQYERAMNTNGNDSALQLLWKTYGLSILLNVVVVMAIGLVAGQLALPTLIDAFSDTSYLRFFTCIAALALCSPFLYAILLKSPKKLPTEEAATILRLGRLQLGIVLLRAVLTLIMVEVVIAQFASTQILPLAVLVATPIAIYFFRNRVGKFYGLVENRFLRNLNSKELAAVETLARVPQVAPWDASLTKIIVSSDSKIAGQSLQESKFRSLTGATVAMIDRGRRRIFAPSRHERILPKDELFLIGTEEQLVAAQNLLEPEPGFEATGHDEMFSLENFVIEEGSRYANKPIRDIGVGEEFGGLIVGIEREGEHLLNPESAITLKPKDLIWIFGHRDRIRDLRDKSKN